MNFRATRILAAALLASSCGLAGAATAPTQTFAVTATVVSNCVITSAGAMAFGNYTPGVTAGASQSSNIVVRCSNGTPYIIGLNPGTGTGSTIGQRTMNVGTNVLRYNLFTEVARTNVWDNSIDLTNGPTAQKGTGQGMNIDNTHTVYGLIPDTAFNQAAAPVTGYTSTVTVTLTY
jgi:spore coat protein U-like protein